MTEQWAPVRLEGGEWYEASTLGRIRNVKTGRVLKPGMSASGYASVILCSANKTTSVQAHRAVASAWLDNFDTGLTVDHVNRVRDDNRVENLRMATPQQQALWQCRKNAGKNNALSVLQLTEDGQVVRVHESVTAAAKEVGGLACTISACLRGKQPMAYGFVWSLQEHKDLEGESWRLFSKSLMVSSQGRIRRRLQQGPWRPAKSAHEMLSRVNGYPTVGTNRKKYLVHRLVAQLFLDPPTNPKRCYVNHKDGNKENAAADNLEWVTPSENTQHAYDNGMNPHKKAIAQYTSCGRLLRVYESTAEASKAIGVHASSISTVVNGQKTAGGFVWQHV